MTRLPGVGPTAAGDQPFGSASALNQLEIDDFLDLMISELQNQDPLNPLENDQLLNQISQIREVGATEKLTETLDAVLLGQNVASATSLIGQEVKALTADGRNVAGIVDRVTIIGGLPELEIDATSRAVGSKIDGAIEAGIYRYKVVFEKPDGRLGAIDIGPIETTGTNGLDSSILLTNLPPTTGPKTVFRTDASGEGDFHFVNNIFDPNAEAYLDSLASGDLSNATLTAPTVAEFGGRRFTVALANVSEVSTQNE